jgi:hypothetical protein
MKPQPSTTLTLARERTDLQDRVAATSIFIGSMIYTAVKKPPLTFVHIIGGVLGIKIAQYICNRYITKTITPPQISPTPPKKDINNDFK